MLRKHQTLIRLRRSNVQGEEHKDFGPDSRRVHNSLYAECFKGGDNDKNSSPAVPQREWKVNPDFIVDRLRRVMLPYNIIDVLRNCMRSVNVADGKSRRTVTAEATKREKTKAMNG